jgi:signal transduction histidine kinase
MRRLPVQAAVLVFGMFLILIALISVSFYYSSQAFYENQLFTDIERRLEAHREVLEDSYDSGVLEHVRVMEEGVEESEYILVGADGRVQDSTQNVSTADTERYLSWIAERMNTEDSVLEFVESSHHAIPHVFAMEPVMEEGEARAYLFVEEATSRFESTRENLFLLTAGTAFLSMLLAGLLAVLATFFMTRPIIKLRNATEKVAEGDFDTDVYSTRQDEIGELSRSVQAMANRLKEYQISRQMLLSNVSHDLRTPLTYVKAYAALLKERPDLPPDQLVKQAGVIHGEALRMERLVEDLFQLTKMDEGHLELYTSPENISQALRDLIPAYEMMAEQEECIFIPVIPSSQTEISLDKERLEQALTNIIRNALRHTPTGGRVTLELKEDEKDVIISVADQGRGVPEGEEKRIWERFYRPDRSRTTKAGGSGLGLPIAKQIVEAHGGRVETGRGKEGAEFFFIFPKENRT